MANTLQGAGVGLRTPHLPSVLQESPQVPWFELLADNWFAEGGLDKQFLHAIAERYPLALHGVNLSLGSLDPLDMEYLKHIKRLKQEIGAVWYSEHCSFSSFGGKRTPDLLPLPYTLEAVNHVCNRIDQVQDFLGDAMLIENISCYIESNNNDMSEAEFIIQIVQKSGCGLLLDINNLYVNSVNHHFNALDYLNDLPTNQIMQIHLAGFEDRGEFLLDTHGSNISNEVWQLYEALIKKAGHIPTLIEWDHEVPSWNDLMNEQAAAQAILDTYARQAQTCGEVA